MGISGSEIRESLSLTELISLDPVLSFQGPLHILLTHTLTMPCDSAIPCCYVTKLEEDREGVSLYHFWKHCLVLVEWQC